jgi:mRNA interferase HigB
MWILSRKRLREAASRHAEVSEALDAWYKVAKTAKWNSLADVRRTYPHADPVDECTVFNIMGNKYRLICWINYETHKIFIRNVLTHAEYNKGDWKNDCASA